MTDTWEEKGPMAAGASPHIGEPAGPAELVDGWELASRVEAAAHEWALRQAELRHAGARLAAVRRGGGHAEPLDGADEDAEPPGEPAAAYDSEPSGGREAPLPVTPRPTPEPAHSALSDLALDILTGGSTTRPTSPDGPV
ncbi:hypothetical protein ACGFR8_32885 [Streptomyces brevispora]|uniref:hypothetical protein n=1 Tax=Streptomyces brevispora TaxID=887462 RepID=UPI00371853CB